jgi:E3 ubiquitin-protein ligase RNF115/126
MAQYLMALLGRDPMSDLFPGGPGGDPAERGRMGDYVFNQEGNATCLEKKLG